MKRGGEWITEATAALARKLWDEGLPIREIAKAIGNGCTKNAIAGYSRRQHFPPRPSPIPGYVPPPPSPARVALALRQQASLARRPAKPVAAALPPPEPRWAAHGCLWPHGDPGEPGFRYCEAVPVVLGRPYCEEHVRIGYAGTWRRHD